VKKEKAPEVASVAAAATEAVETNHPHLTTAQQRRKPFARWPAVFVPRQRHKACWLLSRLPRSRQVDRDTFELACLDCNETAILDLNHDRLWCAACNLFGNLANILTERSWPAGPFSLEVSLEA